MRESNFSWWLKASALTALGFIAGTALMTAVSSALASNTSTSTTGSSS